MKKLAPWLLSLALFLLAAQPAQAYTTNKWDTADSGNWSDPDNWSVGVPQSGYENQVKVTGLTSDLIVTFDPSGGSAETRGLVLHGEAVSGSDADVIFMQSANNLYLTDDEMLVRNAAPGAGATATHIQSGGSNVLDSWLMLTYEAPGSSATYELSNDASLTLTGLKGHGIAVGWEGSGEFKQSGSSTTTVQSFVTMGHKSSGVGTYSLSDSAVLNVTGYELIGRGGAGVFNQTGGTNAVAGYIEIASSGGSGTYNLRGGLLDVDSGITNHDQFNYTGGALEADLTNAGIAALSGAGTRTVNGSVVNEGTFQVSNATAEFTGNFTNHGTYNSLSSISFFNNLTIDPQGYLTGGSTDEFYVRGDFENFSLRDDAWDTQDALLGFITDLAGDTAHDYILGDAAAQFAWDTLKIGAGNSLTILGYSYGDLYFQNIMLEDGLDQLNVLESSFNLHYQNLTDANSQILRQNGIIQANHDYLGAEIIPEPSSMLLLFLGLPFVRRKG